MSSRKKIKRNYRKAKYVFYRETLIDYREHFWAFVGSFIGLGLISMLQFKFLHRKITFF